VRSSCARKFALAEFVTLHGTQHKGRINDPAFVGMEASLFSTFYGLYAQLTGPKHKNSVYTPGRRRAAGSFSSYLTAIIFLV
jgi:hypothetical protein